MAEIKILKESVQVVKEDYVHIYELKFLKDNPRVYACTHEYPNFDDLMEEQQQDVIFDKLKEETSVKNLRPEIERHGGLMEPILVRLDTRQVIEGNSRLAVYRLLYEGTRESDWEYIPCSMVSGLTERQQAAFLNEVHVKGKTQWSPYEKANFAYVRRERGWSLSDIAELFGESVNTIRTRVKVIETMKGNSDGTKSHFSHYDVLVRIPAIEKELSQNDELRNLLYAEIKKIDPRDDKSANEDETGEEDESGFTAQELRRKLPAIIEKPKVLRKYIEGEIDLDEGYQRAKISNAETRVRKAKGLLEDVSREEVTRLEQNRFNAFKQDVRRISRVVERLNEITKDRETP